MGARAAAASERAAGTLAIVAALTVGVAALWALASPRLRVVSLGDGTGAPTFGSDGAQVSATLLLSGMLFGAGAAAAIVLWRRHPALRSIPGAYLAWALVALSGALAGILAPWCGAIAHGSISGSAAGAVVDVSPRLARQVLVAGGGGAVLDHVAFAAWALGGALVAWFASAYLSLADDLR